MTGKTALRVVLLGMLVLSLLLFAFATRARAQSGSGSEEATPAPLPFNMTKGVVSGKVVDENNKTKEVGELDVMLHVLDQNQNQVGMLHGTSKKDGTFSISDVPFQVGLSYAAAVVFDETTYYSQAVPAEANQTSLSLEVPVFESTTDASAVQVEQEHVIFSFNSDGLDVAEIYVLSNLGDKTVKGGAYIPGVNGVKGAVRFNLPEKAGFINFQPQDTSRFMKFQGGFVDTAPVTPGNMVSQLIVAYLLPYSAPIVYETKTALPVQSINFLLPSDAGVTLKGIGLSSAEQVTSQDGRAYLLYRREMIPAGENVQLTFEGTPKIPKSSSASSTSSASTSAAYPLPLVIGLGAAGVGLIGGGAIWWVRSAKRRDEDEADGEEGEDAGAPDLSEAGDSLNGMLERIARLDQSFEQGELDEASYHAQREALKAQARVALIGQEAAPGGAAQDDPPNGDLPG